MARGSLTCDALPNPTFRNRPIPAVSGCYLLARLDRNVGKVGMFSRLRMTCHFHVKIRCYKMSRQNNHRLSVAPTVEPQVRIDSGLTLWRAIWVCCFQIGKLGCHAIFYRKARIAHLRRYRGEHG